MRLPCQGLGSCLHRVDGNIFLAYARWPKKSLWEQEKNIENKISFRAMNECLTKGVEVTPLEIIENLLI